MSQPQLFIGLELEALVTAHRTLPALPKQRRAQLAVIADAIQASGPRAASYTPISAWDRPSDAVWNVTQGATDVDYANAEHVSPFGVRVASPGFSTTTTTTTTTTSVTGDGDEDEDGQDGVWKKEIGAVLKAIDAAVLWKPVPAVAAGLSVHISAPAPFDLGALKRFAMFLCRFEEALDTIGPVRNMNRMGRTLSNRFNGVLGELAIDDVYPVIAQVADIDGLINIMNFNAESQSGGEVALTAFNGGYFEEKYFKVDFTHLKDPQQTLLFRQHDGTTDGEAAGHWAHYMLRFVRFAFASTEDVVKGPPGGEHNRMRDLNLLLPF